MQRKILLYQPHFVAPPAQSGADYMATQPLSLLALGGPLRDAGYEVRIIDGKWEPDGVRQIAATISEFEAVGITCLTGYSVRDGLAAASLIKGVAPDMPVIWGGWHPTFAAGQAAHDVNVDIVIRGQGERTFVEVLDALGSGSDLRRIPGITFRQGTEIVETPDRPPEDINHFPPPAYELVDAQRYVRKGPGTVRHANTIVSRGCPYMCDFCLDSRTKWFGLSIDRVRAELEFWVRGFGVNHIRFYDGNFFLGRSRIEEICHMIIDSDLAGRFDWVATGVAHRMSQMDGDLLRLLRRAGCSQVAIGAESGSNELLATLTNKTTVEQTIESVRRLTAHGINQYLFFIVGFPDEPEDAMEKTLDLVWQLKQINPAVELFINFCVPLPGSNIFTRAVQLGFMTAPREFRDWAELDYLHPNLPNITEAYAERVNRFMAYLPLAFPHGRSMLGRAMFSPLRRAAKWRLERRNFSFPIEAMLHRSVVAMQRSMGPST